MPNVAPGSTAALTYAQLEGLWIKAAESRLGHARAVALAPLMAAIAEAESGGNPGAVNPVDNGGRQSSYGLWQISTGNHTPPAANWADPAANAKLAFERYESQGLGAWGSYNSGAYKFYMSGSTTPDLNVPGNPDAAAQTTSATVAASCWLFWPGFSPLRLLGINIGPSPGAGCLLSKGQARAMAAVTFIGAGIIGGGLAISWTYAMPIALEAIGMGASGRLGVISRTRDRPAPVQVQS